MAECGGLYKVLISFSSLWCSVYMRSVCFYFLKISLYWDVIHITIQFTHLQLIFVLM